MIRFFDDQPLEMRENFSRDYEQPRLIEDSPYLDPSGYAMTGALPSVFWHDERKEYIMLYTVLEPEETGLGILLCAAHSDDAVHWEALDTRPFAEYGDRRLFNQAFPICDGEAWVYQDKRAPREERYKLFYFNYRLDRLFVDNELWVSPDAFHWTKLPVTWNENGGEPGVGCVYSPLREAYVITCRPHWCDRRVCVTETKDWRTFSTPALAMQTDSLDPPLSEVYGAPVFEVEDRTVGLLWKILEPNGAQRIEAGGQVISSGGKMAPELVYSDNGLYYMRSLRKPFLPQGGPDSPCYGCLFASSFLKRDEQTWLITAAASQGGHGGFRTPGVGSVVTFSMKPDRFIYLESNGPARFRTMEVLIEDALKINAHVFGSLRFQLTSDNVPVPGFTFDDCDAFRGDELSAVLTWRGQTSASLKGKIVRLEALLDSGRLYTVSGCIVPGVNQVRRYKKFGIMPKEPLIR